MAQNLFNFLSLPWKLHNPYCHIERSDPELIRHMDTHSRHFKRTNESKEKSLPIPQEARDLCKNPAAVDPTATISLVEENFDSDSGTDSGTDSEMDTD